MGSEKLLTEEKDDLFYFLSEGRDYSSLSVKLIEDPLLSFIKRKAIDEKIAREEELVMMIHGLYNRLTRIERILRSQRLACPIVEDNKPSAE